MSAEGGRRESSGKPDDVERTIEREVQIDVPPATVWAALTEAQEIMRWFPPEARVNPGEGGSVWMKWDDLMQGEYPVGAWEPTEHLRVGFPRTRAGDLVTDYYLEGTGGGTILRVVTSGFGDGEEWDEDFETISYGWDFQLASLRLYLERHRGQERQVVHIRRELAESAEVAWSQLVGVGRFFSSPQFRRLSALDDEVLVSFAGGQPMRCRLYSWRPPKQVFGIITTLGDALFRVETPVWRGRATLLVWLAAYGVEADTLRDLERTWVEAIDHALSR